MISKVAWVPGVPTPSLKVRDSSPLRSELARVLNRETSDEDGEVVAEKFGQGAFEVAIADGDVGVAIEPAGVRTRSISTVVGEVGVHTGAVGTHLDQVAVSVD